MGNLPKPYLNLTFEWSSLVLDSGVDEQKAKAIYQHLCNYYSEPHRHFHTLDHIAQILDWLRQANIFDTASLWAVWFHDCIYQPGSKNNEERSACHAEEVMAKLKINEGVISKTAEIIRATKTHNFANADLPFLSMLDADMAILGVSEPAYEIYRSSIRKEFSSIPSLLYSRGRKKFLNAVLKKKNIYTTKWFNTRFEDQARKNIETELSII